MALNKQPVAINFAKGLDTKTDPYQLAIDNFAKLQNSVFTKTGRLTKRNGFAIRTTLPNDDQTNITTLNDNLIATGETIYALGQDNNTWLNQGTAQPIGVDTLPLVRVSTSQTSPDLAVAASGLSCLVYMDNGVGYYQVSDSATGQQIVQRTSLGATSRLPRVFIVNSYFVITFVITIGGIPHLQYVAVPILNPSQPRTAQDISAQVKATNPGYDAFVANNTLYISWADNAAGIKVTSLNSSLLVSSPITIAAHTANLLSLTVDSTGSTPVIWVSFWDSTSTSVYTQAFNQLLNPVFVPQLVVTGLNLNEITSIATDGVMTLFYEAANLYSDFGSYPVPNVRTDYITKYTVAQDGTVTSAASVLRSVGIASKPTLNNGKIYMLAAYGEINQPSYFFIDSNGNTYGRLAYSNGGGYGTSQVVPTITQMDGVFYCPYAIKDFLATTNASTPDGTGVNKTTDLPAGTPVNAIYTQTGINLVKFTVNNSTQYSSEIAGALHLTGGQLWEYDGVRPVEHGFQVWPENVANTTSTTGGFMTAQKYYYAFTYEWTDNAGQLHRSAPSVPLLIDLTGSGTSTNSNVLYVPTLRITAKLSPNPVRIVGYRWSTAQQIYYQFTSLTAPTSNDTTVDYVMITDTLADSSILGNVILYTTGGVIENIAAPASVHSTLFNNRLWLIDAEDRNLLWYSKQVIESTPVEMSDLLTLYVAPTTGAQGSTGPMSALSAMDDKLIIFKREAIYYVNGIGPDNTGSNSSYSDPVFVTATVGCTNPNSIVLTPGGIMFQSDKGIWLLGRDLGTKYIGAAVEAYNSNVVTSAETIPGTNQVRFILDNSTTLVYDYFFEQWSTFTNIRAISATLWQGQHTYLNALGQVFQETPGTYLDGTSPVLMSFTTAWINLAGLQGFERFYFINLLGTYFTPFQLAVSMAYDYNSSATDSVIVTPDNYSPAWGGEALWGSGPTWGGQRDGNVFTARVFPTTQKCSSFQISIQETYDSTFNVAAGQGLTLSGMLLTIGLKKGYRTQSAAKSFG